MPLTIIFLKYKDGLEDQVGSGDSCREPRLQVKILAFILDVQRFVKITGVRLPVLVG